MAPANHVSSGVSSEVVEALRLVRDSDAGEASASARATIEAAMIGLWQRLTANADYLMTRDEFALFTYFRARYSQGSNDIVAKRAISRYWNNSSAADGRS